LSTFDLLTAIQDSGFARAITKSNHLVIAALQIVHVAGFLLLLASAALMSLRLLGLVFTDQPASKVTREPARLLGCGLVLAVISGGLMFLTGPKHYYYNPAFETKMALLLVAVALQYCVFWRVAAGEYAAHVRITVLLSLLLWFGVGIAGRAIGFVPG
jgi:hypothetical protein